MANFELAFAKLISIEANKCDKQIHKNKTEDDITFMGVYKKYHRNIDIWESVEYYIKYANGDLKVASVLSILDHQIVSKVKQFYRDNFWDAVKGDLIKSQKIAEELFIFAVNRNTKKAIKMAQEIVGVKVDGIIGRYTLEALNKYDENKFDLQYDQKEIAFYKHLANVHKKLKIYLKGWINRAKKV